MALFGTARLLISEKTYHLYCFFLQNTNNKNNQEDKILISAIEDKQTSEDWLLDDAKWNLKIKQLENFEGFDGKHFFTWNKSFFIFFLSTFFTYFIILVQFKDVSPEEPPAN